MEEPSEVGLRCRIDTLRRPDAVSHARLSEYHPPERDLPYGRLPDRYLAEAELVSESALAHAHDPCRRLAYRYQAQARLTHGNSTRRELSYRDEADSLPPYGDETGGRLPAAGLRADTLCDIDQREAENLGMGPELGIGRTAGMDEPLPGAEGGFLGRVLVKARTGRLEPVIRSRQACLLPVRDARWSYRTATATGLRASWSPSSPSCRRASP